MKGTLLLLFLVINVDVKSQTTKNPGFGGSMGAQEVCSNLAFGSDEEVNALVNKILDYAFVVNRNYQILGCSNASSCYAIVKNEQQYIVYKPDYLKDVKNYGFTSASLPTQDKDWQTITILAHEVGHLVNSHFYKCPPNMTDWDKELQADEFAGSIIYQLNGTLAQALCVYNTSLVSDAGDMSHPPRKNRIAAVTKGYDKAERMFPRHKENSAPATVVKAKEDPVNNNDIEMVTVQGGSFYMGSERGKASEKPVHQVTVSSFKLGKYEVTQGQWNVVMGNNPSTHKDCENCPVEHVSWDDIQEFLQKISNFTGKNYRLPTEAEWEFAAKGGNKTNNYTYSGSDDINDVAWYSLNSNGATHPVGQKKANELGIYDMSGNVWEFCSDWWAGNYYGSGNSNPKGPASGDRHVGRGGSFFFISELEQVDCRFGNTIDLNIGCGFRVALTL